MRPYIVKKIEDAEGNLISETEPVVVRRVLKEETSAAMREMMEYTVLEGNGKNVQVAGYRVGGKSGTSQKLDSEDEKARIASFVGAAPIDNPKIAVLVCLDEPHSWTTAGGSLSAPVVASVINDTLEYLGFPKSYTPEQEQRLETTVPDVTGWNASAAKQALEAAGLGCRLEGSEEKVVHQYPAAGTILPKQSTVMVYTEGETLLQTAVPVLAGLSLEEAVHTLRGAGLNLRAIGATHGDNAVVVSSNAESGAMMPLGSVVEANFCHLFPDDED